MSLVLLEKMFHYYSFSTDSFFLHFVADYSCFLNIRDIFQPYGNVWQQMFSIWSIQYSVRPKQKPLVLSEIGRNFSFVFRRLFNFCKEIIFS